MNILIADDEPVARRLLQVAVERLGHECDVATDGTEAWARWLDRTPDVLITDRTMPGLDGLELCRRVRVAGGAGYCYVVIVTALDDAADVLAGMEAGADDYLTKPLNRVELHARLLAAERVTSLHRRLAEREADLAELTRRAEAEARLDALTGLGNRRRLDEDLAALAARAQRYERAMAVALFDLDHFKAYNDRHGHLAGDDVLRAVALTLQASCRGGDVAYRYGGEELAVIMYEQSREGTVVALERMRGAIWERAIPHPGNPPHGVVTLSGGAAMLGARTVDELLQHADAALYAAKAGGRNRVEVDVSLQPV